MTSPINAAIAQLAAAANGNKQVVKTIPYYSVARLTALRSGAGPAYTYVIPEGAETKFFAYAVGGPMTSAGYGMRSATLADTNLQTASQTIDGDHVDILGVGVQILQSSDVRLAKEAAESVSLKLSLNGGNNAQVLGPLDLIGGGTGMFGAAESAAMQGAVVSFAANGYPYFDNVLHLPETIKWLPAGNQDSTLVLVARVERAVTFTFTADAELPPPPPEIYLAMRCRLFNKATAARSVNT